MSDSLRLHELQHGGPRCLSLSPRVCANSCSLSQWCYLTISSSVTPSSPVFNLLQHQGLSQWVSSLRQVAKVLEFAEERISRLELNEVKSLSHVRLFEAPWTVVCQASLSFIISQSLLRFMFTESVMLSDNLILGHPLLLLSSVFPKIFLCRFAYLEHFI